MCLHMHCVRTFELQEVCDRTVTSSCNTFSSSNQELISQLLRSHPHPIHQSLVSVLGVGMWTDGSIRWAPGHFWIKTRSAFLGICTCPNRTCANVWENVVVCRVTVHSPTRRSWIPRTWCRCSAHAVRGSPPPKIDASHRAHHSSPNHGWKTSISPFRDFQVRSTVARSRQTYGNAWHASTEFTKCTHAIAYDLA